MQDKTKTETKPLLADLKDGSAEKFCADIRNELIERVAQNGGHLASNLGVVELTVAFHRVFDTAIDRLVFDVGHQCYPHKLITGRSLETLRQSDGIAGFPKPNESVHDAFIAGHASNSIAVAVGMAAARTQMGADYKVIALIGDGALTGGLSYEGLSNATQAAGQLLIILNDNGMSITESVGGVSDYLARQRLKPQYLTFKKFYRKVMNATWVGKKIYRFTHGLKRVIKESLLPSSMFENMGFQYLGPVDGHDMGQLTKILQYARELNEPALLHVRTVKGKGYPPAEASPDEFHGVSPFDPLTGAMKKKTGSNFSSVFGETLSELAAQDDRICAITAAMLDGTGLEHFSKKYPDRFHDVGIAEGGAVSIAAGMASQGMVPVFAVYSTFLQRAFDMLLHDVAISQHHVVFAVDRAGLVGEDGETHHGVFDIAYLSAVPGMTVLAPASYSELRTMLTWALKECEGPVAIRYPRGSEGDFQADCSAENAVILRSGKDITLTGYGYQINTILSLADRLTQAGISTEVIKINRITPLDPTLVVESVRKTGVLLIAEECARANSVGTRLAEALMLQGIHAKVILKNCESEFVTQGKTEELRKRLGLDCDSLFRKSMEVLGRGEG